MKKIFIIILFACIGLSLSAQTKIGGLIKDASGAAVIGATIIQEGTTNNGTTSDVYGKFVITLNKSGAKGLQVSMIGYATQLVSVVTGTQFTIVLKEESVDVEEVVVVGFGTQKKASVTGAIASIGTEALSSTPVSSVSNALTGRIPGLVTRQTSGRPGGDDASMFIRGRASFNSNSPLVLVDGIERSMSQVNSDDIENVSVLKDASATAVYGVRGANGVILITTKRGQEGASKINFSTEFGITSFNRIAETLNAEEVARYLREGVTNVGIDPSVISNTRGFGVSEYDLYLYRTQKSPFTHPDNNFIDIFTKPGFQQKYNINISGGNPNVKYFVSVGYFSQTGMFETDVNKIREHPTMQRLIALSPEVDKNLIQPDYDAQYYFNRLTTRSNVDIKLSNDLSLKIDMSYIFGKKNRPGVYDNLDGDSENSRLFGMFYRNSPQMFPIMNPNGSMAGAEGVWRQNPLVTNSYTGFRSDYSNRMETNFALNYNLHKVLKGLSANASFSYDANWSNWRGMMQRPSVFSYNELDGKYTVGLRSTLPATGSARKAPTYKKYGEFALRYKETFNKQHNVSGVVLATYTSKAAPGGKYSYVPHIYQALIGRVNYDFNNRYLFEINAGYNGSNRFAEGRRYQLFPAASIGWVLTNEPYFKKNNILNFAKIRASFGEVGNDNLGGFSYYYLSSYGGGEAYSFGTSWNPQTGGLIDGAPANEYVTWESARKYNVGLDSRWFDSKLSLNVDVFMERRSDILCNPGQYTLSAGMNGLAPLNLGIVENKGYEIELGYHNTIGEFGYIVKGIYAFAKNTILDKNEESKAYSYMYQTGNPIGQYIGYHFDGFFTSYDDIASSPQQFGLSNLKPGDMKYKDINGDGIIDDSDQSPIGYSAIPQITYSLDLGLSWKNIELNVLFQGATRSSVRLTGDVGWDNNFGNYFSEHRGRWTPETASSASYPRFLKSADGSNQNYYVSDYWLMDGSYLRLKNVQVSYSLPKKWLKKTFISAVKIYANGYNLATWDKVKKLDPESSENTDGYFYPQQKVVNFGLNITF